LFQEVRTVNEQNGVQYTSCDMTKDGFTLLAMGYTGPKALEFKQAYIERFNAMEAALKQQAPALPDFSNPAEAARAWASEYEARQVAEVKALKASFAELKAIATSINKGSRS